MRALVKVSGVTALLWTTAVGCGQAASNQGTTSKAPADQQAATSSSIGTGTATTGSGDGTAATCAATGTATATATSKVGTGTATATASSGSGATLFTYDGAIAAIIDANCLICHSGGKTAPDLSTYAAAAAAGTASLKAIAAGKMPPNVALSVEEEATFAAWVAAGKPQSAASLNAVVPACPTATATAWKTATATGSGVQTGTGSSTGTGTSTQTGTASGTQTGSGTGTGTAAAGGVTYSGNIKSFLDGACSSCHSPGGQSPDLSTFATAKQGAARSIQAIQNGSMPPGQSLPSSDAQLMQSWVSGGYAQ